MTSSRAPGELADPIRAIYNHNPDTAELRIEQFLIDSLSEMALSEKLNLIAGLAESLRRPNDAQTFQTEAEAALLSKVAALILGRTANDAEQSSRDRVHHLTQALNTLFDAMNQLTKAVNQHLHRKPFADRTIRGITGRQVLENDQDKPLKDYLEQIRRSFLVAHDAFLHSAQSIAVRIVEELEPEMIEQEFSDSLRFGPFKKAACYDSYAGKHARIKKWLDSDRFTEDVLREFEQNCQKNNG